jgi:c-di-GMP-binding flagellar brake protein YcgR
MFVDKRVYYRIFTDIPCRFGREAKMYHRQVNISAGGVAFMVMPEMVDHFVPGEKIPFAFELNQRHFQFDSIVIRRNDRNFQTMAALQFCDLEPMTQKTIDNMILSLGGYRRDDNDKKREYLAWYAPNMLHQHNTQALQNVLLDESLEELDMSKLDDISKHVT